MAAPSLPALVSVGQRILASYLNGSIRNCLSWVMKDAPAVRSVASSAQSIPTGAWTSVLIPSADSGDEAFVGSPTSRLLLGRELGWWLVWGVAYWDAPTTGTSRRAVLALNGNHIPGSYMRSEPANPGATATPPTLVQITSATDYVELQAQHDAPTSVPTLVDASRISAVHAVFLRTL